MDTCEPRTMALFRWDSCENSHEAAQNCAVLRHRTTRQVFRSCYCTDGMILAAGTRWPSRVGGQGIAMNQSNAT
jgi:hypothetical protein